MKANRSLHLGSRYNFKPFFQLPSCLFKLIFAKESYLQRSGWLESFFHGYPCNEEGSPIPWMNYSIVMLLEDRLTSNLRVFEYGSGYSTLFFSKIVKEVYSVEHNQNWYKKIQTLLPQNATIQLCPLDRTEDYQKAAGALQIKFDLILIDGRQRVKCFTHSLDHLSNTGIIILDDSKREKYAQALSLAKEKGFKRLDFESIKPLAPTGSRASLFYRDINCLGI